ncbi:hypothetical protein JNM87_02145 [Candidatus Saccharibacteria bacterium]|nr:hypothetical protein [Candidatus Saccharibacteria bacterium]
MKVPDKISKVGWAAKKKLTKIVQSARRKSHALKERVLKLRQIIKSASMSLWQKVLSLYRRVPWFVIRILITLVLICGAIWGVWQLCLLDLSNPGIPDSLANLAKKILTAKPQLQYISDLAAFTGVILAIAVPLGIDIVQKVSGYYAGSRTIRERLQHEWQMEWMVPIYLMTVLLALTSRFFFIDISVHPEFQRAVSYVLLLLLFIGLLVFAWYLNRLYVYTLDQKKLKLELSAGLVSAISRKKKSKYLDLIEAYGDLVVSEARNANLKTLIDESLPFLEDRIKQMIPRGDLEDAEKFLLSDEFFEIFNKGKQRRKPAKASSQHPDDALADSTLAAFDEEAYGKIIDFQEEAKMRLYFDPDRYMLAYLSTIQQIIRVYQEGLNSKNDDLTTKAVYSLIRILSYFARETERGFYIELLLRRLAVIARQSAKANDVSMHAAAGHWYTSIVFDKYEDEKYSFQLEYLNICDRELYSTLKFIVDGNHKQLFTSFVGYLVDGLHEPLYSESVWDLGHMPLREDFEKYQISGKADEVEKVIKELDNSTGAVNSIEQVRNWQNRLQELKKLVRPLLKPESKIKADKLTNKLARDIEEIYKHANLRELVFSLGAYCMFKKRYDFVKEVFEYKQPSDSDASWGGNDIQPETVAGVTRFYFQHGSSRRDVNFWEGHHGSGIYTKRYFICLLARAISRNPEETVQLGNLTPTRLSDINYSYDGLKQVAADIANDEELLQTMGLQQSLITDKVLPMLDTINEQAKSQLLAIENNRGISIDKVKEFREEAAQRYEKETHIRSLLAKYGKVEDETQRRYVGEILRYGISRVDEKAVFFDEWYVSYGEWGHHYGEDLGRSENNALYQEIKSRCRVSTSINTIEKAVRACDAPVILAPTRSLFRYEDSSKFIPNWRGAEIKIPEAEWDGFAGAYIVDGKHVPVFEIAYFPRSDKEVAVVDMKKMPVLRSLSPLADDDPKAERKGNLAISVQAFSEETAMTDDFLAKPPEWLQKVGDSTAQRQHLMTKVLIQIYERYELTRNRFKLGYLIDIKVDGK